MYQAAIDITIDGRPYKAGEDLDADCPEGCLVSCLRLGQVVCSDAAESDSADPAADGEDRSTPAASDESGSPDPHAEDGESAGENKPKAAPKRKKK